MRKNITLGVCLVVGMSATARAEDVHLAFRPAEQGYYVFDTGLFRGRMRVDGRSQGIASIVHGPTAAEMVVTPGVFSFYRVFSTSIRYGHEVRDWPVEARVLEDGGLEIRFPPAADHPMEVSGIFRWRSADTLDLETRVKAAGALPCLELFLSSYFAEGFDASVYVKRNLYGTGEPAAILPVDWSELLDGNYVMFPRDAESLRMLYDGRWEIPPSPVTWAFVRYLAAPIAVRRQANTGLTAVLMSSPDDCFALSAPYNRAPPDNVSSHRSLYISLFGRDLPAGQVATARCRLILAKDLSSKAILQRYTEYVNERK
jgi:hypothetical protein